MREFAEFTRNLHDPEKQQGQGQWPERCAHCHYTRHPCDVFDLASMVLALLDTVVSMSDSAPQSDPVPDGTHVDPTAEKAAREAAEKEKEKGVKDDDD